MRSTYLNLIALSLSLGIPLCGQAATLFRCEAGNGHLTFSQHGCPPDQQQRLQRSHNATPGSGKPIPLARPATSNTQPSKAAPTNKNVQDLTVVGERQDGCGNLLSESERRTAIIQGRIRTGMTRADVESAFGKPDKISQTDNRVRYLYAARDGKTKRSVSFDEFGCVKTRTATQRR